MNKNKIYQLYSQLYEKHGDPAVFWPQWCAKNKTEATRELVAIGAILTQRTSWHNADLALENFKKENLLSLEKIAKVNYISRAGLSDPRPATKGGTPLESCFYSPKAKKTSANPNFFGKPSRPKGRGFTERLKKLNAFTELIRPAGFYQSKPKRLFSLASFIVNNYGNLTGFMKEKLNVAREKLLGLYGIGPETADTILLYALDRPTFVIDAYTQKLVKKEKIAKNLEYNYLKQLFEENLPKDTILFQSFHTLIIVDQKGREGSMMRIV